MDNGILHLWRDGTFRANQPVLYLLPERWMAEYGKAMTLSTETA